MSQLNGLQLILLGGSGNSMDCRFQFNCEFRGSIVQIFTSIVQIWIDWIGIPVSQILKGHNWLAPGAFARPSSDFLPPEN